MLFLLMLFESTRHSYFFILTLYDLNRSTSRTAYFHHSINLIHPCSSPSPPFNRRWEKVTKVEMNKVVAQLLTGRYSVTGKCSRLSRAYQSLRFPVILLILLYLLICFISL